MLDVVPRRGVATTCVALTVTPDLRLVALLSSESSEIPHRQVMRDVTTRQKPTVLYYRGVVMGVGVGFLLSLLVVRLIEGAAWYLVPTLIAIVALGYCIVATGRRYLKNITGPAESAPDQRR